MEDPGKGYNKLLQKQEIMQKIPHKEQCKRFCRNIYEINIQYNEQAEWIQK